MDIGSASWFIPVKGKYFKPGNMDYYVGSGPQKMERGVKIHISAKTSSASVLATWLLPELIRLKVFHKVLADTDFIAEAPTNNQRRKFIVIYPQNSQQLDWLCEHINGLLFHAARARSNNVPVGPLADCYPIEGDMGWGRSGYVFIRHGNFVASDPSDDRGKVSEQLHAYLLEDKTAGLFVPQKRYAQ